MPTTPHLALALAYVYLYEPVLAGYVSEACEGPNPQQAIARIDVDTMLHSAYNKYQHADILRTVAKIEALPYHDFTGIRELLGELLSKFDTTPAALTPNFGWLLSRYSATSAVPALAPGFTWTRNSGGGPYRPWHLSKGTIPHLETLTSPLPFGEIYENFYRKYHVVGCVKGYDDSNGLCAVSLDSEIEAEGFSRILRSCGYRGLGEARLMASSITTQDEYAQGARKAVEYLERLFAVASKRKITLQQHDTSSSKQFVKYHRDEITRLSGKLPSARADELAPLVRVIAAHSTLLENLSNPGFSDDGT